MNMNEKYGKDKVFVFIQPSSFGAGTAVAALSACLPSPHSYDYEIQSRHALTTAWMQKVEQRMERLPRTTTTTPSSESLVRKQDLK